MDAAEFVVGNVYGPGKEPEHEEREKTRGKSVARGVWAAARKEHGGKGRAGDTEGSNVLAVIGADAEIPGGDPDQPGNGIGEDEVEPDLALHVGREISSNGMDGNWIRSGSEKTEDTMRKASGLKAGATGRGSIGIECARPQ